MAIIYKNRRGWIISLAYIGLICLLIVIEKGRTQEDKKHEQEEDKTSHNEKCPQGCKICTDAVQKALDFLANKQKEDGRIPAVRAGLGYVKIDKDVTNIITTALAGLAFIANGSTPSSGKYKEHLLKIRDYLQKKVREILRAKREGVGAGGGPLYCSTVSLLFFVHLYEIEKDDKTKETVQNLVKYISNCIGEKIKDSVWKDRGGDNKVVWYISGVTALVNLCVISLTRAESGGFEVDDKIFDLVKKYYAKIFEKKGSFKGSFKYDKHDNFPHEPRQGRGIAALLALTSLGVHTEDEYKSAYEYARKNIKNTMTHHIPSMHMMLCAFTFHTLGKEDWKRYVEFYFDKLIKRQKKDGSIPRLWDMDSKLMMTPNDLLWGKTYATAHFALILQIPLQKVTLLKSKK